MNIQIEFATSIYINKLREAEHHCFIIKTLAGTRKHSRNPIQALNMFVLGLVKKNDGHGITTKQTSALPPQDS